MALILEFEKNRNRVQEPESRLHFMLNDIVVFKTKRFPDSVYYLDKDNNVLIEHNKMLNHVISHILTICESFFEKYNNGDDDNVLERIGKILFKRLDIKKSKRNYIGAAIALNAYYRNSLPEECSKALEKKYLNDMFEEILMQDFNPQVKFTIPIDLCRWEFIKELKEESVKRASKKNKTVLN